MTKLFPCDNIIHAACNRLKVRLSAPPYVSESIERGRCLRMYAILETGGKQYRVEQGDTIYVEKLAHEELEIIEMDKIIAVGKDDGIVVGAPYVDGASVTAKVVKNGKGKKITVFTYRSKKGSKRKLGHRQPYTKVEILEIKA